MSTTNPHLAFLRLIHLWLIISLLCPSLTAQANQTLPTTIKLDSAKPTVLQRCAVVPMRVFGGLIKVGDAALYLQNCGAREEVLEAIPKRFTIALARDASGQRLARMARDLLADNLGAKHQQRPVFQCLTEAYIDATEGDRYDVSYIPETGLQLHLNERLLANCPDSDLAPRYFSIWSGEEPFNKRLRDALLHHADSVPDAVGSNTN